VAYVVNVNERDHRSVRPRGCHRESAHLLSPRPAPFSRFSLPKPFESPSCRPISFYFAEPSDFFFHESYVMLIKNDIFIRYSGTIFFEVVQHLLTSPVRSKRPISNSTLFIFFISLSICYRIGDYKKYKNSEKRSLKIFCYKKFLGEAICFFSCLQIYSVLYSITNCNFAFERNFFINIFLSICRNYLRFERFLVDESINYAFMGVAI